MKGSRSGPLQLSDSLERNRCPLDNEELNVEDYLAGKHVSGSAPCRFEFSAKVGY
jgi:hypothetical protein